MKNPFKRKQCKQCGELLKMFDKTDCCNTNCYNLYKETTKSTIDTNHKKEKKVEKFKKNQLVKSGHYSCNFIVIGYKYDNYFLAIRENEEDDFTNRELLYDGHCFLIK